MTIDNASDRNTLAAPQTHTGIDINPLLYDTLGGVYRAGLRYNFPARDERHDG